MAGRSVGRGRPRRPRPRAGSPASRGRGPPGPASRWARAAERHLAAGADRHAGDDVHRADERGDEQRGRPGVDVLRRADLVDAAAAHDADAVGDHQRLFLVVGHVEGGDAERALEVPDVVAQLDAQLRVQVGQRLVHQEDLRVDHHRAGQRHALLLPARQLVRQSRGEPPQLDEVERARGALGDLPARAGGASPGRRRRCRPRSGGERSRSPGTPCRCCGGAPARRRWAGRRPGPGRGPAG